jgi:hypothetical protein
MIDADVDPHQNILSLANLGKDISSGNVFCWINGVLMPSIWERAECEQCRVVKIFMESGKNHDETQYKVIDEVLYRWNPFQQVYTAFANRDGILEGQKCRCKGTGMDPFVYRVCKDVVGEAKLQKVDSVGAAAIMIHRKVFEKMPFPWFRFLYRESGEILLTEDHYFCWKAGELGLEVWADPQLACHHYKTVDLLQLNQAINMAYNLGAKQQAERSSVIIPTSEEIAAVKK